MKGILVYITVVVTLLAAPGRAERGVEFAFEIYGSDSTTASPVLLFADTADVISGIPATGFLLNLSLDMKVTALDSQQTSFEVHVVSLGPPAYTSSKRYTVEYGLPAILNDIPGKNNTSFRFVVIPLAAVDVDTALCSFNHHATGTFVAEPTANMDLYYVPNSLGDYYWDSVKGLFEQDYRLFKKMMNFSLPGKYNIYLCPCALYSVLWDKRFGMMVDPTRRTAYTLFTRRLNTAEPFAVLQASALRNLGYTPPFLSEGLANYFSFALYDMKKILKNDPTVSLASLMETPDYFRTDPHAADRSAATFVKYLIDTYSLPRFLRLWKEATDLNLKDKIEAVYDKKLSTLEKEWKSYVDTSSISLLQLTSFIEQAELRRDYPLVLEYAKEMVRVSQNQKDSVLSLGWLVRAYFFTGDYYEATNAQKALVAVEKENARNLMALAAYKMMNGYYDEAKADLEKAHALDTADYLVQFNLAMNALFTGDTAQAKSILQDLVSNPTSSSRAESMIFLGHILKNSPDIADRTQARMYFQQAIQAYDQELQVHKASPTAYMWLGIAFLGLEDTDMAADHLQTALFLETRPFYLGMIYLWLGKVIDVLGDRETAETYYGKVLSLSSADYYQKEARTYLETPYTQ